MVYKIMVKYLKNLISINRKRSALQISTHTHMLTYACIHISAKALLLLEEEVWVNGA